MKKLKATLNGYAVSSTIKEVLQEEGYVILRIISAKCETIKLCEAFKILEGTTLPKGTDTVLSENMLSDYGTLLLIDEDFAPSINIK